MTLKDLIKELIELSRNGVPDDTEIILFAEHTEDDNKPVVCQMDTLSISLNGDCVQLFMQGDN